MKITRKKIMAISGIKFSVVSAIRGEKAGRVWLYILHNDLHQKPFGLMEDLFVEKDYRKMGIATQLINEVIKAARRNGCYKLIATSRHERIGVHKLYEKIGFKNHGVEFRMDFCERKEKK